MGETLIRFVMSVRHEESGFRDGFFRSAYRLRDSLIMTSADMESLADLLLWFDCNIEEPDRFNRTKSKGWQRRNSKGLSWFRTNAGEQISKAYGIVALLRKYGHEVEEVRTNRPGFVVYTDEHQVVAEPFSDVVGLR
jgi:hypothetical protein